MFRTKKLHRISISLLFSLFILSFLINPYLVFAQSNSSVSVMPSIRQLDLAQDLPEYAISYQNNTSSTVELKFSATDFSELEDGWKINFLDQKDANLYKYSLSSWIELASQSMVLKPGEKNDLKVSVKKERLPAGGHYGSILAQINTFETDTENHRKEISLQGTISSLLFVRANTGAEITNLEVFSFSPLQSFYRFPETVILKIRNTGNTYTSPFGSLQIYDPFGRMVSKSILNEGSLIVLPETIRTFQLKPASKTPFLWPGIYHSVLTYHFGNDQNNKTYETSFFSFGTMMPAILGVIIVLIISLMQMIKSLNRHKKK